MTKKEGPSEKNNYKVYHWDTFEEDPDHCNIFLGEFDEQTQAEKFVEEEYKGKIGPQGADKVQIVFNKTVVKEYKVQ